MVKNLLIMQKTRFRFLGWENPLEKEWLPTLASLPREFHGQRSLEGYYPWGHKESDRGNQVNMKMNADSV